MSHIQQPTKSMATLVCTLVLLMVASVWFFNQATASQEEAVSSSNSPTNETQQDNNLNEDQENQNNNFVIDEEEEEGDEEDEERERERNFEKRIHEMEQQERELNLRRAEMEVSFAHWEMINRVREVAENRKMAAAYSVMMASEIMEREAAIDFLEETLEKVKDEAIARLIHIKLSELYGPENVKKAKRHLQQLILD